MGYHVIIKSDDELVSYYVEKYEELAFIPNISKNSIVYKGESHWTPSMIKDNDEYSNLTTKEFRAGLKAEVLFKKQAEKNNFIVEKLSQDPESFQGYTQNADKPIKRGDYLIRNVKNLEVEVKCFKFYKDKYGEYIKFPSFQYTKHKNMQELSGAPVVIAVYQRSDDSPVDNSLRMISINMIQKKNNKEIKYVDKKYSNEKYSYYKIPLVEMNEGFSYFANV